MLAREHHRTGMPRRRTALTRKKSTVLTAVGGVAALAVLLVGCTGLETEGTSSTSPTVSASSASPTPERLSWGPLKTSWQQAQDAVQQMSVEELTGQIMVATYQGTDTAAVQQQIRELHLGGVILMGWNIPGAEQGQGPVDVQALQRITQTLQGEFSQQHADWPGIIAVDQEGGVVSRVREPATEFPTLMAFGAANDKGITRDAMLASATELRALGFTMDFAPDADVTAGPQDPVIGSRSLGSDPQRVAELVPSAVEGYVAGGVIPSVKHFPGHGSVTTDSHIGLPVQPATIEQLKGNDWIPFQRSIQQGTPMVMVGHLSVDALEAGVPSSLSSRTYEVLRKDLGFEGVTVTDGLNMGAVVQQFGAAEAAVRALEAGADIVLMPEDTAAAHQGIVEAVKSGRIPEARLKDAATRVIALQLWQAELSASNREATKDVSVVVGSHSKQSEAVSAQGITVVSGQCAGDHLSGSVQLQGGTDTDRERFVAAAQAQGVTVGQAGPVVSLISFGGEAAQGDIVVSLDTPYALADSVASTKIALYGNTPESYKALFAFLTGKAGAPGTLPVQVGDKPVGYGCGE